MTDNRQIMRDSLFVLADMRVEGLSGEHRIKVRNLSSGGMMGEGSVLPARGATVEVLIRNLGWICGSIAWVHGGRFGVAFTLAIDPKLARQPATAGEHTPRYLRPCLPPAEYEGVMRQL